MKSTWKAVERRVAALFDSVRTPLSGNNSKHTSSDSLEPFLFIETKYRAKHSVLTLFDKTAKLAEKEKAPDGEAKLPVVALVEKGKKDVYFLVRSNDIGALLERHTGTRRKILARAMWLVSRDKRRENGRGKQE